MFTPATIISIEGPDKVGKETQSKLLAEDLESQGFSVKIVDVPVNSLITHTLIYWMLSNGLALKFPTLFQVIQFFNKLWFQLTKLAYYRFKYSYVILDRWSHSAYVYGKVTFVSMFLVNVMFNMLRKPDVTISIKGDSFLREKKDDVYESDSSLQSRVRHEYDVLGRKNVLNKNFIEISNEGSRELTHERIMKSLKEYM